MTRLYQWWFEQTERGSYILRGTVTGHPKLPDSDRIHTTRVRSIRPDPGKEAGFLVLTRNTEYHCSMESCHYARCREMLAQEIPNEKCPEGFRAWAEQLETFAGQYDVPEETLPLPATDAERFLLLRLGNNRAYYFHSMWIVPDSETREQGRMSPHIGTFQDSVLCRSECSRDYDLRYFPYRDGNLAFYHWETSDLPVYIENRGDQCLRVRADWQVYLIEPGACVRISPEYATPGAALTSTHDLYTMWDI